MTLSVQVAGSVHEVAAAEWDAMVGEDDPFLEHAFLGALEDSGSVGPGTGWLPTPLVVRDAGRVVGACPLYLRGDSYGEYVFDWAWADAARRAGLRYYPKLTVAVPFTPATGRRLLVRPGAHVPAVRQALAEAIRALAREVGASSAHVLFPTEEERDGLVASGWFPRLGVQFHWEDRGWKSFEDWLASLTRKRRHEALRERRRAREGGVRIDVVEGPDLTDEDWRALHAFYRGTAAKMGAVPYLRNAFWTRDARRLAHRVVASFATLHGTRIAGTFNLRKGAHLYGRYWGAREERPALHFECCYHALVEWAIANGIRRFEAGAQGEHKLARGFLPRFTHSAHLVVHPGLAAAARRHAEAEEAHVRAVAEELLAHSPYRSGA